MTTYRGYSLVFIPLSWAVGVWRRPHKTIYSFGPFRFAAHYALGPWEPFPLIKPRGDGGVWLSGPSRSEWLSDDSGTPAGGALEPVEHKRAAS